MKGIGMSHRGKIRKENQDAYRISNENPQYYMVADGMGGHKGGSTASNLAVELVGNHLNTFFTQDLSVNEAEGILYQGVYKANKEIYHLSQENPNFSGMGTTLTVIVPLYKEEKVIIAHIGDSRGYLWEKQELIQLTEDHSFVEEMVKNGNLTKEEALVHPKRNIITKALGATENMECDIVNFPYSFEGEGKILLCSDGLTNALSLEEMKETLSEDVDSKTMAERLLAKANDRGGRDNITVLVVENGVKEVEKP